MLWYRIGIVVRAEEPPEKGKAPSINKWQAAIIALVGLSLTILLVWYVADYAYVESQPVGRYYNYDYFVMVDNASTEFVVMLPVPIVVGGEVLPQLDFTEIELEDSALVETEHGQGLRIGDNEGFRFTLEGAFDARKESEDHRSDENPILSMSSLNHSVALPGRDNTQTAWIYSDVDGLEIRVHFKVLFKNWRVEEGTFHDGYVRGGGGHDFLMVITTEAGWHEYPMDIWEIEVE
jgi:hypothetical protein